MLKSRKKYAVEREDDVIIKIVKFVISGQNYNQKKRMLYQIWKWWSYETPKYTM